MLNVWQWKMMAEIRYRLVPVAGIDVVLLIVGKCLISFPH
jgi:hypothetical protein